MTMKKTKGDNIVIAQAETSDEIWQRRTNFPRPEKKTHTKFVLTSSKSFYKLCGDSREARVEHRPTLPRPIGEKTAFSTSLFGSSEQTIRRQDTKNTGNRRLEAK
jgi:hypothetical protein